MEGKLQSNKQRRSTDQLPREAQELHGTEVRKRKRPNSLGEKRGKKVEDASEDASADAAARSKRKVERLRKQLEKEEKRVAKAEARASKDKVECSTRVNATDESAQGYERTKIERSGSGRSGRIKVEEPNVVEPKVQEATCMVPDPLTPTSQPALADEEQNSPPRALNANGSPSRVKPSTRQGGDEHSFCNTDRSIDDSSVSKSDWSSESLSTDSEVSTSSSGSSSDGNSDDNAPEETHTIRESPERVAPPQRKKPKQICRAFLHNGRCKRGSNCKYLHELPERGGRGRGSQEVNRAGSRKGRIGLYQRVSHNVQLGFSRRTRVLTICWSACGAREKARKP